MKNFALILLMLSVTFAMATERYKDRLFPVNVKKDVAYAKNVPHLSSYHKITEGLLIYKLISDDATVAYF